MIRHVLLLCLALSLTNFSKLSAQEFEIGVLGGVSVYSGDLSPDEIGLYLEDANPSGGLYLRYRPVERIAFRLTGFFGKVSASDEDITFGGTEVGQARNFRSSISDVGLTVELDILRFGPPSSHLALYVAGGGSMVSFDPEGNLDGTWYRLQPLATEGQGLGRDGYAAAPYSLTEFALNLGGGLRYQISNSVSLGAEVIGRRMNSDYLDDVSNTQVNYLDILENTGRLAAQFSNPTITDPATADRLDYTRGGEFADYFFSGTITLGITLGQSGGGKRRGCYQF